MRWLALLLLVALGLAPSAAAGQGALIERPTRGEFQIEDLLQVLFLDRELVAIDAADGTGPSIRLEIGERLLQRRARGRVGVAITDRRILAVSVVSGSWQRLRYRQGERPPLDTWLGDRVALMLTAKRVIGFDGGSGNLIDEDIGPLEKIIGLDVSNNVAVVVTDRRALGLSPFAGGFFPFPMRLQERLESIDAQANIATITTSRRVLTFRSPIGSWAELNRNLR